MAAVDISRYFYGYLQVVTGLLIVMDDHANPRVQAHAGAALVNFSEDCPKSIIVPYLDTIIGKLDQVLTAKFKDVSGCVIMSTPLGGGYIIFAFSAVRCPLSDVRRPMSGVTHGFRSFKGKVLELLSPNLVCRLIGSVACLGLLLAVVPLLLTE